MNFIGMTVHSSTLSIIPVNIMGRVKFKFCMQENTTAERIAEYIHQETKKRIPSDIELEVTVWETETSWVSYTDKDV